MADPTMIPMSADVGRPEEPSELVSVALEDGVELVLVLVKDDVEDSDEDDVEEDEDEEGTEDKDDEGEEPVDDELIEVVVREGAAAEEVLSVVSVLSF
ncbi:hypothetical protein PQX77_000303 [Marasmius sp. AFHP31]|nr:hypothetical protein PQX77_000303 [Marasmius sp. AFHP31]